MLSCCSYRAGFLLAKESLDKQKVIQNISHVEDRKMYSTVKFFSLEYVLDSIPASLKIDFRTCSEHVSPVDV